MLAAQHRLATYDGSGRDRFNNAAFSKGLNNDEFPYQIELWKEDNQSLDRLLAIVRNMSIANAAFRAAVETFPNRLVILRFRGKVITSRIGLH
jgi:hypothetical protein